MLRASPAITEQAPAAAEASAQSYICTSVTATKVDEFIAEIQEAAASGVDIIELRLDFLTDFDPEQHLQRITSSCPLPYIVTYRPVWEGGKYDGPEPERLAVLKMAALMGAPYVDVEFKASPYFFAGETGWSQGRAVPLSTKVILSYHDFQQTPEPAVLDRLASAMRAAGADIVKLAAMANDITDAARMLDLLRKKDGPMIALSMGEKGQIVRLLAAKYGGYLTFAAMSPERASAPGQPDIGKLAGLFGYRRQGPETKVYGIIGNPVSHSKSPLIHNTAFQHVGFDGVYVPLLVDDLERFLTAFKDHEDFAGFSVTIPHKEAALRLATEVDPVARQIGAVNTLVRQPDGSFKGFNTDWLAAISAIEHGVAGEPGRAAAGAVEEAPVAGGKSPLQGKTVVVIGAGGAGRALAFGAATKGARVVIANRSREKADLLAAALGSSATSCSWEDLVSGRVTGDVLANSTSLGMTPHVEESPVGPEVAAKYKVVFDAVYNPLWTRLLQDARAGGAVPVDGLQMFVGQALEQFRLFTGGLEPPAALMEKTVMDNLGVSGGGGAGGRTDQMTK
ncbi:hypothetical protein VOLCADRAFT_82062 [Volvox carteri f. nagariensis]|uniref:Uncharacterized protein n=1 Tax=Volvox carteri f. nagariensis TaxID=3068 RepID=D8U2X6_VOLCA|nr:uncharacterized protein VOLCADRAFT_82062 [Volvox carteri f. nagariensis]EFJ45882.1 hypothetical protein VOLCADRAFT_82062 [Volvox carteri f. nagariensis]|eukprot:XP_002952960.1 hypothetical protein VOLCADRAFT_82062 [Volvox carteri f. nagariensis]